MGLDITAYSNVSVLPDDVDRSDLDGWGETWISAFAYAGFHRSTRGLVDHDVARGDGRFIAEHDYDISKSAHHYWHGGSYGGYGRRRAAIAEMFDIPSPATDLDDYLARYQDRPFFELVWFADNEGAIGHEAAADLLGDFLEHRVALLASPALDAQWLNDWTVGLALAASDGLVRFW